MFIEKCSNILITFRHSGITAESVCYLRLVRPSFGPHVLARLPPVRFPWNLILETVMWICLNISKFGLIGQRYGEINLTTKVRLLPPATWHRHKIAVFGNAKFIKLLRQPRRDKCYANAPKFCMTRTLPRGHAVAQLVEALLYKPEGRGFDSRCCNWIFLLI